MRRITIASGLFAIAMIATVSAPAFAARDANVPTGAAETVNTIIDKTEAKTAEMIRKADQEIARRIGALTNLQSRITAMKKVSEEQKDALRSTIKNQIADMNSLKVKIDADTNLPALNEDMKTITKSYRIYVLVIPKGIITAAADRILTITEMMAALGGKFDVRISEAKTAGKDTASVETILKEYNSKVQDAESQARSALDEIASLKPDDGNQAILESNRKTLQDARAKIVAAQKDLAIATQNAKGIIKGLKNFSAGKSSPASVN